VSVDPFDRWREICLERNRVEGLIRQEERHGNYGSHRHQGLKARWRELNVEVDAEYEKAAAENRKAIHG